MRLLSDLLVLFLFTSLSAAQAPGLLEVLKNSGASDFANAIQSDPNLSGLFLSSPIGTVYAPSNGIAPPVPPPGSRRKLKRDITTTSEQQWAIQAGQGVSSLAGLNDPPGLVQSTGDPVSNTGGGTVPVVSSPNAGPHSKRWTNSSLPALATLFSGLGNNISITKGNIPYSGGLVHITNGFFTLPQSLTDTATATGQTAFVNLTRSTNLTATLDSTASITAFVPTNAALASHNATRAYASTSSLLAGHIVPDFLGYLPVLKDGATFKTQAGTVLTVSVKGGAYYINNAKIVAANQILENGVAHVIDQVITPQFSPPIPFTGTGSSLMRGSPTFAVVSTGLALLLGLIF